MAATRKRSVIERLRQADRWLDVNGGAPMAWVRELLRDAAQELESESGALWLQTITGRDGHARLFVHGPFGAKECDVLIEVLQLTRSWMERDEQTTSVELSPPAAAVGDL